MRNDSRRRVTMTRYQPISRTRPADPWVVSYSHGVNDIPFYSFTHSWHCLLSESMLQNACVFKCRYLHKHLQILPINDRWSRGTCISQRVSTHANMESWSKINKHIKRCSIDRLSWMLVTLYTHLTTMARDSVLNLTRYALQMVQDVRLTWYHDYE